jgi:GNAT superfamily N-acetyltransferase
MPPLGRKLIRGYPRPQPVARRSWTPRSAVRRAVEVWRESGPRVLAQKVFAELFYRRLIVYEASLDAPRRPVRSELPLRFGVVGPDQAADYLACVPTADAEEFAHRMSSGHRCYAARLDGEVVAVRWACFHDIQLTVFGLVLHIAEDDAYLYGAYTKPKWRRNGIAAALTASILDRLQAEGYRHALSAWVPENSAARSLNPSRGQPVAVVRVLRAGPWWRELRPRPPAARGRFSYRHLGGSATTSAVDARPKGPLHV